LTIFFQKIPQKKKALYNGDNSKKKFQILAKFFAPKKKKVVVGCPKKVGCLFIPKQNFSQNTNFGEILNLTQIHRCPKIHGQLLVQNFALKVGHGLVWLLPITQVQTKLVLISLKF
jgi:hypothetical protein